MSELKQVFTTPDGEIFDNKADAMDHLRRPKILEALQVVTGGNDDLAQWLVDNQDTVVAAFDTGTIRRITKSEYKKIEKAYDAMAESGDKVFDIFVKNRGDFAIKYRPQPRMNDDEKRLAARNTLMKASNNNEELADWAIKNEAKILEAYDAGKEKRPVSPKAQASLAAYRAGKTAEKEAREAGKSEAEAAAIGKKVMEEAKAAITV